MIPIETLKFNREQNMAKRADWYYYRKG